MPHSGSPGSNSKPNVTAVFDKPTRLRLMFRCVNVYEDRFASLPFER